MMRPAHFAVILALLFPLYSFSQKYTATEGFISFFSSAPLEEIMAENRKVSSLYNAGTGDIAFSVPINQFQFEKKLMQEHFNEKYMESEKYPRATFSGKIYGHTLSGTSPQQVMAKGKLSIHGVVREVEIPGTIEQRKDLLVMKSKFRVRLEDYEIKIPRLVWQKIAEEVEVIVDLTYIRQ
ncbi:MAG: YceI family protein [Cyclobacteriaceae bacterium]|nr:YceI family protein [Cyclobacteriaceae bacterium]